MATAAQVSDGAMRPAALRRPREGRPANQISPAASRGSRGNQQPPRKPPIAGKARAEAIKTPEARPLQSVIPSGGRSQTTSRPLGHSTMLGRNLRAPPRRAAPRP
eukprot:9492922-Pyramimonas_sp.AAC.1